VACHRTGLCTDSFIIAVLCWVCRLLWSIVRECSNQTSAQVFVTGYEYSRAAFSAGCVRVDFLGCAFLARPHLAGFSGRGGVRSFLDLIKNGALKNNSRTNSHKSSGLSQCSCLSFIPMLAKCTIVRSACARQRRTWRLVTDGVHPLRCPQTSWFM